MFKDLSRLPINRLIENLRNPLYRNGYALIINSVFTSGLGLLYWILAARFYPPEILGLNSAILSAIIFISSISQFNMVNILNRFIPTAGSATRQLIFIAYGTGISLSIIVGTIFVFGIDIWAPALSFIKADLTFSLAFIGTVIFWCIFAIQDSILIGLRQSTWVLVENTIFALAKLALLIVFAKVIADYGVWASWSVPIFIAVIIINIVLFYRWIPEHIKLSYGKAEPLGRKQIAKYIGGENIGQIFWVATVSLLPLLVTERVSVSANAYFYLAWTIGYSLYLVGRNMGMSLTTEGSMNQKKLNLYAYQTLLQTTRLLVPLIIIMVIGTPYLLQLLGRDYVEESTTLLRLLTIASLPAMVTSLYISIARVQRKVGAIIFVQMALCFMVLGGSFFLLDIYGIVGVGIAWLGTQTLVASVLLATHLRPILLSNVDLTIIRRLMNNIRQIWWKQQMKSQIEEAYSLIPAILSSIAETKKLQTDTWSESVMVTTLNDVIIIHIGPTDEDPRIWLKMACSHASITFLKQQEARLNEIYQDTRLNDTIKHLIPECLLSGQSKENYYIVETAVQGIDSRKLYSNEQNRKNLQIASIEAITQMHRATASNVLFNEDLANRWIDHPLQLIREVCTDKAKIKEWTATIDRLSVELHKALDNREMVLSWVHGDFWAGNILVNDAGTEVTGLVDWESALPLDWSGFDILQLLISSRTLEYKHDLNLVLQDILEGNGWTEHEKALLDSSVINSEDIDLRTMIILSWLNHVSANFSKTDYFQNHWIWVMNNVHGVLDWL